MPKEITLEEILTIKAASRKYDCDVFKLDVKRLPVSFSPAHFIVQQIRQTYKLKLTNSQTHKLTNSQTHKLTLINSNSASNSSLF